LKIEKGSIVEWRMNSCSSEQDGDESRHVIAFESPELQYIESEILKGPNDSFKVRFLESGVYSYRCPIKRMRGSI
jgi:plastocyanin